MADWGKVKEVLDPRPATETALHHGDSTALIPHTFISVLRRLHVARLAKTQKQSSEKEGETRKNAPSIGPSLVREVSSAIQELHRHFENVLSNRERLKDGLRGYEEGNVIWVDPKAQQDFVSFLSLLWDRWGGSCCNRQDLSDLVEWALQTDIDSVLGNTGVERAAEACCSVQSAFDTFQNALDKMLKVQGELNGSDDVEVN